MSREPIAATGRVADYLIDPLFSNVFATRLRSRKPLLASCSVFRVTSIRHGVARVVAPSYATYALALSGYPKTASSISDCG
jgi:hypothetical protein